MKICIWTDNDLDGACSALLLKKIYESAYKDCFIEIKEINDSLFERDFEKWTIAQSKIDLKETFNRIFIVDHHIPDSILNLVDQYNVRIIDHHKSHFDIKDRYKQAKAIIDIDTSSVAVIRRVYQIESATETKSFITPEFLDLLDAVNDYDCYKLKHKDSLSLNAIYGSYKTPRVNSFITNFENGLRPFTILEKNIIKLYFNKLKDQLQSSEYFKGNIKNYSVIGCFATHAINEVAHFTLKKYKTDIVIVINPNTKNVSFRRSRDSDVKLNIIAEKLCDGGGHEAAAGGKITDTFLKFTTTLISC